MSEIQGHSAVTSEDHTSSVTLASGAVIFHDGKVLLVRDQDTFWKVPGGSCDDEESIKETCIREVAEEVGLRIIPGGEPFVYVFNRYDEHADITHYYVLFHYRAEIEGSSDLTIESGSEAAYFYPNDLPEELAPNVALAIDHFKSHNDRDN